MRIAANVKSRTVFPATPTPKPHEDQACDGEEEVEDRKPGVHTRRGDGGAEGVIRNADARYGVLCTIVREQICERILACLVGEYDGPSEVLLNVIISRRAGRVPSLSRKKGSTDLGSQ